MADVGAKCQKGVISFVLEVNLRFGILVKRS